MTGAPRESRGWHYALELHKKPAIGAWCLVLALLGATVVRGIRRAAFRWVTALALYWMWFAVLRLGEQAADTGQTSAALAMWAPIGVAAVLVSMSLWYLNRRARPTRCTS